MRVRTLRLIALFLVGGLVACRTGVPVVDRGPKPPTMEGTIAGVVRSDGNAAIVSRVVRATALSGGKTYETTTNNAGGYTLKVPPGRYKIQLELKAGERIVKEPGETEIDASDLDPHRDFVIAPGP